MCKSLYPKYRIRTFVSTTAVKKQRCYLGVQLQRNASRERTRHGLVFFLSLFRHVIH